MTHEHHPYNNPPEKMSTPNSTQYSLFGSITSLFQTNSQSSSETQPLISSESSSTQTSSVSPSSTQTSSVSPSLTQTSSVSTSSTQTSSVSTSSTQTSSVSPSCDSSSTQTSPQTAISSSSDTTITDPPPTIQKTKVISFDDLKPKETPKKWETYPGPTIQAFRYKIECHDSVGDMIHDAGYFVDELFIPEYNIVLNITTEYPNKHKLSTFEHDHPRIVKTKINKEAMDINMKIYRLENLIERKQIPDDQVRMCYLAPEDRNYNDRSVEELTLEINRLRDTYKALSSKDEMFDKLVKDGTIQEVSVPLSMVQHVQEILKTQKILDQLKVDWITKYA